MHIIWCDIGYISMYTVFMVFMIAWYIYRGTRGISSMYMHIIWCDIRDISMYTVFMVFMIAWYIYRGTTGISSMYMHIIWSDIIQLLDKGEVEYHFYSAEISNIRRGRRPSRILS